MGSGGGARQHPRPRRPVGAGPPIELRRIQSRTGRRSAIHGTGVRQPNINACRRCCAVAPSQWRRSTRRRRPTWSPSRRTTGHRAGCCSPGGPARPRRWSARSPGSPSVVRDFVQSGKPVASIRHGPWNFVEADIARGRRLTSWPSVRTDLCNAGAEAVDEQVTDGNITTSRSPEDLPAFCERIVHEFAKPRHPPALHLLVAPLLSASPIVSGSGQGRRLTGGSDRRPGTAHRSRSTHRQPRFHHRVTRRSP